MADLPRLKREAELRQDQHPGWHQRGPPYRVSTLQNYGECPIRDALTFGRKLSPRGSRNLLALQVIYTEFMRETIRPSRETLHEQGLKGFH